MSSETADTHWMRRAVEITRAGLGSTAPNPTVGAVLVRDGALLAEGHTMPLGQDHAELVALRRAAAAGVDPRGATMYVTLEPCCHHGRTPPCTDALIAAGIARVVVGVVDPFPAVCGKGLDQLRSAGISVELGAEADACAALVLGFTRVLRIGLPEVTCKAAITLNGVIATGQGESRWISGEQSRADGHALRASHDAILVGIGTVLADDPRLTCRHGGQDPVPVVLDTELRVPLNARLFGSSRRPLIITATDAPDRPELPADVVRVPRGRGGLDIWSALGAVAAAGLHRVLVEGGGQIHRSLLDAGLVDHLRLYLAGLVVPGGIPWVGGPALGALADATRWSAPRVEQLGDDVLLCYELPHRGAG